MRILAIAVLTLLSGCLPKTDSGEKDNEVITENLLSLYKTVVGAYPPDQVKAIVIIPLENSCESCRERVMRFAEGNVNNPKIRFVITSNEQRPGTSAKITSFSDSTSEAFIIEKSNLAFSKSLISVFPVVFYLDDMKVIRAETLSGDVIERKLKALEENIDNG